LCRACFMNRVSRGMAEKPMLLRTVIFVLILLYPAINVMAQENEQPRDIIMVGGNSAYPPYEFLDMDGKPSGFVVELTQAIADAMGFDVSIKLGESWTDMRKALEKGDVDVLQGISYSEDRAKILDFSPPHSFVSHSIFARKGAPSVSSLDDLRGKEVILMGRGVMYDYFVQAGFELQPVLAPTVADAVKLLASGKSDYAVLATLPALYLIKDAGIKNIKIVAKSVEIKKYCYAVKKGRLTTLAKFNEGLALLKQTGRYRELQEKWLGGIETQSAAGLWFVKHSVIIVISLFVGLLGSVIWSRMLKQQVAVRTADLQHEVEERKRAAEALKLQQQQLVQADKMAALGVLVSGMAHEINNPNGLILLNLPLIIEVIKDIDPVLDAHFRTQGDFQMGGLAYSRMRNEVPELLEEMQDAAKRIKRIVDDLKHFSKKSDAEFKEQVDLNAVVRTSLRLVENALKRSEIQCKVRYASPLPLVKGNSHRLEQVVVNLVLNACQAIDASAKGKTTPGFSPLVDILNACDDVKITLGRSIYVATAYDYDTGSVMVKVSDNGVGIPPEHIPRLTDPFFTTKRDTGGTGLGLAISDEILREHGGTIRFESVLGEGTMVTITLPATAMEVWS
jgi:polar amino acid transport system substrate-binding protein